MYNRHKIPGGHSRVALGTALAVILTYGGAAAAANPIDLAQEPLFLGSTVAPNVFLQLDDSGSMGSDYIDVDPKFPRSDYGPYDYARLGGYSDDWRTRNIFPGDNTLAFNGDPAARSYSPWWDTDYGDSDFDNARKWPTNNGSGRNLSSSRYIEWVNDKGASSCVGSPARPNGPGSYDDTITTSCGQPNVIDAWDTYRVFTIYNDRIRMQEVSFAPDGSGRNATLDTTTLTGGEPELHGQSVAEVQQRYANYYTYYRTRRHTLVSAVGATLKAFPGFRFGTNTIHDRFFVEMPGAGASAPFDAENKSLYDTVKNNIVASGGTPLRNAVDRAGKYYGGNISGRSSPINNECQQNFLLAMTDGQWKQNYSGSIGDVDGDGVNTVLGDIGRHYYENDLAPGIANEVQSTVEDPKTGNKADYQHMVSYGIAFGVTGNLEDTDGDDVPDVDKTGTLSPPFEVGTRWMNYPIPIGYEKDKTIDDLWHMAFNSTGEFLSATKPTELTQALKDALASIASRTGSGASVTATSTSVSSSSAVYQAQFDSSNWSGDLKRTPLQTTTLPSGNQVVTLGTPDWTAAGQLDGQDWDTGRSIITRNDNSGDAVAFRWSNLSASQQAALNDNPVTVAVDDDGKGQERLQFVRGKRDQEQNNSGSFRDRASVLGDIIHSAPVLVARPRLAYPDNWGSGAPENGTSYSDFQTAESARTPIVYVGGNDGMVHGVTAGPSGGQEKLGYVPLGSFGRLNELSDPRYKHRYFADGELNYADAFFDDTPATPAWRSVLTGTLRTGGRGVYALDVTDPSAFSEANAADIALWEFTPADDADMGNVVGSVPIVRLNNDEWAAIFGNGFNNTGSGNAVLYIVDVEDGSLIKKIDTGKGPSDDPTGNSRPNGLAAPTAIDTDGDSIVDAIYAGDLFGNLWKFDVTGGNASSWGVATAGNKPLFQARSGSGDAQPITTAPAVGFHPKEGGFLVYFGTGKYLGASDNTATGQTTQSLYGIWDQANGSQVTRSKLVEQTIDQEISVRGGTQQARIISDNPINWTGGSVDEGWFMDLDEPGTDKNRGERVVTRPVIQLDRVQFSTLLPDSAPCGGGGGGFLMALAANNGGRFGDSIFDINNDGRFDSGDESGGKGISGLGSTIGILSRATIVYTGTSQAALLSGTNDPDAVSEQQRGPSFDLGRTSWRQLR